MGATLLFEIGVEEIPVSFVLPALGQLQDLVAAGLERNRLGCGTISTYGTPRRLAVMATDVADRQPDERGEVKGPPAAQAYTSDGQPTPAAQGFARSRGVEVGALQVRDTSKGRFVFALVAEQGRPAVEVLAELLPAVLTKLRFPKQMRWGDCPLRFARPLRWLVAMLGDQVIPFEVAGVAAGCTSQGHRFGPKREVVLARADDYLGALEEAWVVADHRRRQELIAAGAQEAAQSVGGRARVLPPLLAEVCFLVEHPTALAGRFDERFLALPEQVLVTVMAKHQRYFPVEDERGRLRPHFIALRNGGDRALASVREGNERVVRARFEDAEFYFRQDTQRPLSARLPDLGRVTFLEGMGSLQDKTQRLVALAERIGGMLGLGAADREAARRAAELCKADLVTLMVQDLSSLQGVVGGEYARLEGEPAAVCAAIAEHYRPAAEGDQPPATAPGRVLALADKLDNLCACFALGMIPTGGADPHALRRQAAGIVSILVEAGWRLDLTQAAREAVGLLPDAEAKAGAVGALLPFVAQRLEARLEEQGVAHDLRRAVLATGAGDPLAAHAAAITLAAERDRDRTAFERTTFAGDRVRRIIAPADVPAEAECDPCVFVAAVEGRVHNAYRHAAEAVRAALDRPGQPDTAAVYEALSALAAPIDDYFDKDRGVMVMDEDLALRRNRLALLRQIDALFGRLADFREIVIEGR